MTEFVVRMANRPGMLASLTETLAAAGINIDALAAYGVDDEGIVRLVVDEPEVARRALRDAGLHVEEHQVVTTYLSHRTEQLATVTRKLADAGVNIDALYVLHTNGEGIELAIAVDAVTTAREQLALS